MAGGDREGGQNDGLNSKARRRRNEKLPPARQNFSRTDLKAVSISHSDHQRKIFLPEFSDSQLSSPTSPCQGTKPRGTTEIELDLSASSSSLPSSLPPSTQHTLRTSPTTTSLLSELSSRHTPIKSHTYQAQPKPSPFPLPLSLSPFLPSSQLNDAPPRLLPRHHPPRRLGVPQVSTRFGSLASFLEEEMAEDELLRCFAEL